MINGILNQSVNPHLRNVIIFYLSLGSITTITITTITITTITITTTIITTIIIIIINALYSTNQRINASLQKTYQSSIYSI
jgi:hypothetical protein